MLPCADKHAEFSQHWFYCSRPFLCSRGKELQQKFSEGKIFPLMDASVLRTEDLLVCETRPSPERITTNLKRGQPRCSSSWMLWRKTKHDYEEGSLCKATFLMVLDSCRKNTLEIGCVEHQVFWCTHLSEIFALLKETGSIASAQQKSIITLFLIWKVHLLSYQTTTCGLSNTEKIL